MSDFIKGPFILFLYLVVAPAIAMFIRGNRRRQRWAFGILVFMTSWQINKITMMLDSIDWYRGATKGFEFGLMDVMSIAILLEAFLSRKRGWRFMAPGAALYLLYVALSMVSILNAPEKVYTLMAALRFAKATLVYLAAFQFLHDTDDLLVMLRALAVTLIVQMFVVLKMKYKDHVFQVMGWFEHQNALAMWSYMCGFALLAAAIGPASKKDTRLFVTGYLASGIMVQSALSRASLLAYAIGTAIVFCISFIDQPTRKRLVSMLVVGALGVTGLMIALPTLMMRFGEDRNQQSAELRVMLNASAAEILRDHPLGGGWNNFVVLANNPYPYGDVIDDWTRARGMNLDPDEVHPQPESHYWLMLAENGYPGFFAYLLFILVTTFWCVRGMVFCRRTATGAFLIGVTVAMVITYLHSNYERVLTQTKNLYTWLIFLGFVARIEYERRLVARNRI
ncbi:MAG TPA: O-antigen ligase family protein [Chthoniobacteraceae bacterium]|jgi:hypothetical protein|nr:O-antigen ligase family protein [Chthoniobacteraceae bacterium]